jgi:hypothetical protein
MKKLQLLLPFLLLFVLFGFNSNSYAQNGPVLYFCEYYGSAGEVGISDRFTTGFLTVMVKSDDALGLSDVTIQFDKYNCNTGVFKFYKKFNFDVESDMKYIYFSKNETSDMNFEDPGIYRVFLLDENDRTVTSGLVEVIR